jgi:hypothetical protein
MLKLEIRITLTCMIVLNMSRQILDLHVMILIMCLKIMMKIKIKYSNMKKIITKRYEFYIVHITLFFKIFLNIILINF